MSAVIALLRAVNVGGRTVKAAELKEVAASLGHRDVATYVNSGNLVLVPGADEPPDEVAAGLSEALTARFGFDVPVIARSVDEWDALVDGLPFVAEAATDPAHVVLFCFAGPLDASKGDWDPSVYGNERVVWGSSDAYIWYPDGIGRSKLKLDRHSPGAGVAGTARNWRTVLALADLAHART